MCRKVQFDSLPSVPDGDWIGISDHRPIVAEVNGTAPIATPTIRVPWWKRNKTMIAEKAKDRGEVLIPHLTELMEHAVSTVLLEDLYKRWENILTKPYTITSIPRPRRFKPFWDHRLDQMGKKRRKLYKWVCQTGSDKDWSRYKSLNKRIKKMVKKKKQDSFKEFAEGLLRASPSEATATINRITKAQKGYQAKHTVVGKSLPSEVMTQHIRETFKSPRNIAVILEPFEVTEDMENEILNATGRAPLAKAPRPDLIIGESLRAA